MKLIVFVKAFSFYREYSDVYESTKQSSYIWNEKSYFCFNYLFKKLHCLLMLYVAFTHLFFLKIRTKHQKYFFSINLKIVLDVFLFLMSL